jgi:hypothetical protein
MLEMSAKKYSASDLPKDFQDCEIISDPLNRLIKISKFEKRIILFTRLLNIAVSYIALVFVIRRNPLSIP